MNIEDVALIQIRSVDEVLEDVHMTRARHRDVINSVELIKKALLETKTLRNKLSGNNSKGNPEEKQE